MSCKLARANNKDVPENHDNTLPSSYIAYLDCNNLYGTAMTEPLPERDFRLLSPEEVETFNLASTSDFGSTGYFLEVDIEYPDELHDLHSDYPVCPEVRKIDENELSPYTKSLAQKLDVKPSSYSKLVCDLNDKTKYVVHYRNLKYYVELGLRVKRVHRIVEFTQSRWLKSFIDFNTEMRKKAKSNFEKDFYKLLNNAVYGKTLEQVRKHKDVKFATSPWYFEKLVFKPTFKSFKIFSEDLTAVHLVKSKVVLNKPTYVGMTVLELSKLIMFRFHYDKIKKKYGEGAKLLMTDTDSLVYSIATDDFYADVAKNLDWFDTSDYPTNNPAHSQINKKVLGKFKDEMNGSPIVEFVGLRPKMYSIMQKGNVETKKTAKGISTSVKKKMKHETYLNCLRDETSTVEEMYQIRSDHQTVVTAAVKKTGLSPYDDKRYVLNDKVSTLAHGHYLCTFDKDSNFELGDN